MSGLAGKHALVTGGGTGIGAAITGALVAAGAKVTIAGRRKDKLDAVASRLKGVATVAADITFEADCDEMVKAARAAHGPIDIVVPNAGAAESAPFGKLDRAAWQRAIDVNLTGAFQTVRAAHADLVRKDGGEGRRIVFVASTAALKGYAYVAAYVAAKHGVLGLTRALSVELAATGVTVNAVCPGFTDTPLLAQSVDKIVAMTGRSAEESAAVLARDNPHGKLITPQEVAAAVLWLCSREAGSVNGQAIAVAGGAP